jgi:hypothetical protein
LVAERITADAWARLQDAHHRWEESTDRKLVRELGKIGRELKRRRAA